MITVIVPVYKVEAYLERCVDSILTQTYPDFEVILVDDGSPDRCPAICDAYREKDPRVRVIHKPNGGLSSARNTGLDHAKGDFIAFIDSDDWIEPDMLETLCSLLASQEADLACCNFVWDMLDGTQPFPAVRPGVCSQDEYWARLFSENRTYYVVAWNKLYRRALFDNCRYAVNRINEDDHILYDILSSCDRIAISDKIGYHYIQRENSIMNTRRSEKNLSLPEAYVCNANKFAAAGKWKLAESSLIFAMREMLLKDYGENTRRSAAYVELRSRIRTEYHQLFPHLSSKRKLSILLFLLNEPLARFVYRFR